MIAAGADAVSGAAATRLYNPGGHPIVRAPRPPRAVVPRGGEASNRSVVVALERTSYVAPRSCRLPDGRTSRVATRNAPVTSHAPAGPSARRARGSPAVGGRRMRSTVPFLLLALAACADAPSAPVASTPRIAFAKQADAIAGEYIVVLRAGRAADVDAIIREKVARHGGRLRASYTHALAGYAAS